MRFHDTRIYPLILYTKGGGRREEIALETSASDQFCVGRCWNSWVDNAFPRSGAAIGKCHSEETQHAKSTFAIQKRFTTCTFIV